MFLLTVSVAAVSVFLYTGYESRSPDDNALQIFNLSGVQAISEAIDKGERFIPLRSMMELSDFDVFPPHASNLHPYEPIFGFRWEYLKSDLRAGDIREIRDGRYNITNPSGLCFPGGKWTAPV